GFRFPESRQLPRWISGIFPRAGSWRGTGHPRLQRAGRLDGQGVRVLLPPRSAEDRGADLRPRQRLHVPSRIRRKLSCAAGHARTHALSRICRRELDGLHVWHRRTVARSEAIGRILTGREVMIASVEWKQDDIYDGQSQSGHMTRFDATAEHTAGPSPMEAVLTALCACTSVDVVSILRKKREPLQGLVVTADAEQAPAPPRTFTRIHLTYKIRGPVTQ